MKSIDQREAFSKQGHDVEDMRSFFLEGVDSHMKRNGDHLVEHCHEDVLFSNILGWEKLCTQVLGPIIAVSRGLSATA